jgi:hypothetical protein
VRLLLGAEADHRIPTLSRDTPLHLAVAKGHVASAVSLLCAGADPNPANGVGNRPLHCANSVSMLVVLLQYGADSSFTNKVR